MRKFYCCIAFIISIFFMVESLSFANDIELNRNEVIFSQKTYKVSAIDPNSYSNTQGRFYPGLRGANQMIVYTNAFGLRTNTNEFGSEAIVTDNIVSSLSGADSIIPHNGMVISGHGRAKKWISENIIVGAKVYLDKNSKTLKVYITSDSYIYAAKEKIKEAREIANYYRRRLPEFDYQKAAGFIQRAEKNLKRAEKNTKDVKKYSSMAIEYANLALDYSVPYYKNELKGVWIRPTERSEQAIVETLDEIQKVGINNIFLETFFHGKTIFPSNTMECYGFQKQNENFKGFDPLKIWISEAHKRGIKVNIWFESFYVGNKNPINYPQSILAVKPSWSNLPKRNFSSQVPVPSISEHNGYFLDPANYEVQNFLISLLTEIIYTYKPDGINLDYIRYPQSVAAKFPNYDSSNWGYTQYARQEFTELYGIDPVEIGYSDNEWSLWDKYRQDKVSEFVEKVSKLTDNSCIILTTVIFPDRQNALETKQQDWKKWSHAGYIDGFTPLLLTSDSETAAAMMRDVNTNKSSSTALYAGIFSIFMGTSEKDLLRLIHISRKMQTKGVILFDYAHLNNNYKDILMASVFNKNTLLSPENSNNHKVRYMVQKIKNQTSKR